MKLKFDKSLSKFAFKFYLRPNSASERGAKQFGAPLADPYAVPNLNYQTKVGRYGLTPG